MAKQLQVRHTSFIDGGGNPCAKILPNSPDRIWVVFTAILGGVTCYICSNSNGLQDSVYASLITGQTISILRYDFGPLVTGEFFVTNGVGLTPACQLVISEGTLT